MESMLALKYNGAKPSPTFWNSYIIIVVIIIIIVCLLYQRVPQTVKPCVRIQMCVCCLRRYNKVINLLKGNKSHSQGSVTQICQINTELPVLKYHPMVHSHHNPAATFINKEMAPYCPTVLHKMQFNVFCVWLKLRLTFPL